MTPAALARIHLVLRHDAVLGREDQRIHSSVTQIDLHDFSRLCLTYGLGGFHCITEMASQHQISQEILAYWQQGPGQTYNPDRVQALSQLNLHSSFDACLAQLAEQSGEKPLLIGTSAREVENQLDFPKLVPIIEGSARPVALLFGTAWGLSPEQLHRCDWVLPPIQGRLGYNHLSVRCAAAIIVDRLSLLSASTD